METQITRTLHRNRGTIDSMTASSTTTSVVSADTPAPDAPPQTAGDTDEMSDALEAELDAIIAASNPELPEMPDDTDERIAAWAAEVPDDPHYVDATLTTADMDEFEDMLKDLDVSKPEDARERMSLIGEQLAHMFLQLSAVKAQQEAQVTLLHMTAEVVNSLPSPDEIEDMQDVFQRFQEISDALSVPFRDEDVSEDLTALGLDEHTTPDPELAALERDLDALPEFNIDVFEEPIDKMILAQENMEILEQQEATLVAHIQRLQRMVNVEERASSASFSTRQNAKVGGHVVLIAAAHLVPVTAVPVQIAQSIVAAVSLAKTLKHIRNLSRLKQSTRSETLRGIMDYAISQKKKKAVKQGVMTVGGSALTTAHAVGRAGFKKLKGTKGKERNAKARALHELLVSPEGHDPAEVVEALKVISELVGPSNMREVRTPDGWKIIEEKLRSTS